MLFLQGRREPGCVNLSLVTGAPVPSPRLFLLTPSLEPLQQGGGKGSDIDNRHRGSRTRGSMRRMEKERRAKWRRRRVREKERDGGRERASLWKGSVGPKPNQQFKAISGRTPLVTFLRSVYSTLFQKGDDSSTLVPFHPRPRFPLTSLLLLSTFASVNRINIAKASSVGRQMPSAYIFGGGIEIRSFFFGSAYAYATLNIQLTLPLPANVSNLPTFREK